MGRLKLDDAVLARLDGLIKEPAGRGFGVLGLGVSGRAMALFLARRGAVVTAADLRADIDRHELEQAGVTLRLGPITAHTFDGVEALAITPGADPRQPAVQAVLASGRPVCGELDLAGRLPARVAAVTGTNGKSTTTSLLGALVRAQGLRAFVGGNLGDPVVAWLDRQEPADVAVLELSSFQLETAYRFNVDVGVLLNVTPDHYDRYADIEAYARAKAHLVEAIKPRGVAVLNWDDPYVAAMASRSPGRVWWFSRRAPTVPDGATLAHDELLPHGALAPLGRLALSHARLIGKHNRENAMAAILAAYALGVTDAKILTRGYQAFVGLEHRLEMVAEVNGVLYINDSKATNDDAAAVALGAVERPVVLLAGGRDKGGGYGRTLKAAARVRLVVAFGEARELIAKAFQGQHRVEVVTTFKDAFTLAASRARPGDAVLLAPACSSFDEFKNYAERGRAFKALVLAAERGAGGSA